MREAVLVLVVAALGCDPSSDPTRPRLAKDIGKAELHAAAVRILRDHRGRRPARWRRSA